MKNKKNLLVASLILASMIFGACAAPAAVTVPTAQVHTDFEPVEPAKSVPTLTPMQTINSTLLVMPVFISEPTVMFSKEPILEADNQQLSVHWLTDENTASNGIIPPLLMVWTIDNWQTWQFLAERNVCYATPNNGNGKFTALPQGENMGFVVSIEPCLQDDPIVEMVPRITPVDHKAE